MYTHLFAAWVIGLVLIWILVHSFSTISAREKHHLYKLFSISYTAILVFGSIAYNTQPENEKKKYKHWSEFINNYQGTLFSVDFLKKILVGLVSGLVFGVIDNTGLWFGMEALDPILPKGTLTRAGYGNVYADTLSAFLSTFAGKIISNIVGAHETPLWANAIGTTCGCLTGLHVSRAISGRH